jgi:hypothetical protein
MKMSPQEVRKDGQDDAKSQGDLTDRRKTQWHDQVDIAHGMIWLLYRIGRSADIISQIVNNSFPDHDPTFTPDLIRDWTKNFADFRDSFPTTRDIGIEEIMAGLHIFVRQLDISRASFLVSDKPEEQRGAVLVALNAVCEFIEGFVDTPSGSRTAPLRALMVALLDLGKSTTHPMLTPANIDRRPNRPYGANWLIAKAIEMMQIAMDQGKPRLKAAADVAKVLHERGYRLPGDNPIKPTTITNWRSSAEGNPRKGFEHIAKILQNSRSQATGNTWDNCLEFLDRFEPDFRLKIHPQRSPIDQSR